MPKSGVAGSLTGAVSAMSTRLISIIAMFEGVVLLALSFAEIRRVRQEYLQLKAAQQLSAKISDQFANTAIQRRGLPFHTTPDVLGNFFDDDSRREMMPWRITLGIGAALFGGGLLGVVGKRGASRSHGSNGLGTDNPSFGFRSRLPRPALYLLLFGIVILTLFLRISLERYDPAAPAPVSFAKIRDFIYRVPGADGIANWYSRSAEGVSAIRVPYNRADGPWIGLEESVCGFAQSNGIQIVRFEGAGSQEAFVCVKHEDASAMKKFVRSMNRSANKPGPATSAAAGSGR